MKVRVNPLDAKPVVKWAGGKRRLLPEITARYPFADPQVVRYGEPFTGGGAVLLDVVNRYEPVEVYAADSNAELVNMYVNIRDDVEAVVNVLQFLEEEYLARDKVGRGEMFYESRATFNNLRGVGGSQAAALLIFLNKTCFNGLYRVNADGEFNVPHGTYVHPKINDADNLREVSAAINQVNFVVADYHDVLNFASADTFVYFDPPYRSTATGESFAAYTRSGFNDDDQRQLADVYHQLRANGVRVMLSNSDPTTVNPNDDFFEKLYAGSIINRVAVNHCVGRDGSSRRVTGEILVQSY